MCAMLAQAHDRALAEASLNLAHGRIERLLALTRAGPDSAQDGSAARATICRHTSLLIHDALVY